MVGATESPRSWHQSDLMDTAALKGSWAKVAAAGEDVPLYFYSHCS